MRSLRNALLAVFFLALLLVLLGGHFVEFILKFTPCALCYLQRIGMLLAAFSLLLYAKDQSAKGLGICLLSSLFGFIVALRHVSLKFCCQEDFTPMIFGKSLPAWSLYVFSASLVGSIFLVFLHSYYHKKPQNGKWMQIGSYTLFFFLLIGLTSSLYHRGFSL